MNGKDALYEVVKRTNARPDLGAGAFPHCFDEVWTEQMNLAVASWRNAHDEMLKNLAIMGEENQKLLKKLKAKQ